MKKASWVVLTIFATVIALMSTRFFLPDPPHIGEGIYENFIAHKTMFLGHVGGSLLALLIGPWQLATTIRGRWPFVHRWMGRAYVVMVLIGGISGFIVAWTSSAGMVASIGFASLSILWLYVTYKGFATARARKFVDHRKWMIRSFALTAAAITLRMGLPIAPALGYDFVTGYIICAWACWLINLGIAEIYLRKTKSRKIASYS